MRAKVNAAAASEVVRGPGKVLVRNKTATAAVFYEVGAHGPTPTEAPKPVATEAAGWEVPGNGVLEVALGEGQALTAIVKAAGAEQELELLRVSSR
jgi:hypothetical protein